MKLLRSILTVFAAVAIFVLIISESKATEPWPMRYDTDICWYVTPSGAVIGPGSRCSLMNPYGPCFRQSDCVISPN